MQNKPVSRAGLLELRNERRVVEDGHRFLDEKRALLAHAVLERLAAFETGLGTFGDNERRAHDALEAAVGAEGLEALQLRAPAASMERRLSRRTTSFLGIAVVEDASLQEDAAARDKADASRAPQDMPPSSEVEACARRFADLIPEALPLATELGNLLRLMREFQRTQRRVRALEKVVLPELRSDERRMEEALEEVEQEDALRVRLSRGRGGPGQGPG